MKKFEIIFNGLFSIFAYLFGGFDALLKSLCIIIIIDYITGMIKALYKKQYSGIVNLKGVLKKIGYLIIICLATILDNIISDNGMALRTITLYFFIANDSISILENWESIGLPIPKKLKSLIEQLREDNEK